MRIAIVLIAAILGLSAPAHATLVWSGTDYSPINFSTWNSTTEIATGASLDDPGLTATYNADDLDFGPIVTSYHPSAPPFDAVTGTPHGWANGIIQSDGTDTISFSDPVGSVLIFLGTWHTTAGLAPPAFLDFNDAHSITVVDGDFSEAANNVINPLLVSFQAAIGVLEYNQGGSPFTSITFDNIGADVSFIGFAVALTTLMFACGNLPASDVFVDNVGGDDRHKGNAARSSSGGIGPTRTIRRALQLANRGDRIVLAATGVPYRESITMQGGRIGGVNTRPFVLEGNGAILDGSSPIPQDAWKAHRDDVYYFQPKRIRFQQIFLDGLPAQRVLVAPGQMTLPELKPLEWCLFDRRVFFRAQSSKPPWLYDLRQADLPVGITLFEVRHVVVSNLIVQGFQLDGINVHNDADCRLESVTSRGNGRSGVSVGGSSRVEIMDCLLGNNGQSQLRTEGFSHTKVTDTEILEHTDPAIDRQGGQLEIKDSRPPAEEDPSADPSA